MLDSDTHFNLKSLAKEVKHSMGSLIKYLVTIELKKRYEKKMKKNKDEDVHRYNLLLASVFTLASTLGFFRVVYGVYLDSTNFYQYMAEACLYVIFLLVAIWLAFFKK